MFDIVFLLIFQHYQFHYCSKWKITIILGMYHIMYILSLLWVASNQCLYIISSLRIYLTIVLISIDSVFTYSGKIVSK